MFFSRCCMRRRRAVGSAGSEKAESMPPEFVQGGMDLNDQASIRTQEAVMSDGPYLERANPVSGEVVTRVPAATVADARHAANVAASAFPAWSSMAPTARREIISRAADVMLQRAEDVIA